MLNNIQNNKENVKELIEGTCVLLESEVNGDSQYLKRNNYNCKILCCKKFAHEIVLEDGRTFDPMSESVEQWGLKN